MRARLPVLISAAAVIVGVLLSAGPAAAQEARPPATPSSSSWVLVAADRLSAVVLEVLDEARVAAEPAPAPPPPPPVTDPTTWIWPADGPITSPFGPRWGRQHAGVDVDAPDGSPVVAPQRGTVTLAGWDKAYGNSVIIDHGEGITSRHAHLDSVLVSVGQVVEQGHHLGGVGATGAVTGSHLHYEVHVGGVPQNPMAWLQGPRAVPPPPAPVVEASIVAPAVPRSFS